VARVNRRDPRLWIIAGALIALVAVVVVAALAGSGGDEGAQAAAPPECIQAWNTDPDAIAYGRHNYGSHGYDDVQVTMLTPQATEPAEGERSVCAVVFGALQLDSEAVAAGQLLLGRAWEPIALQDGVELTRVGELQQVAAGRSNASLDGGGKLAAD
jgi:hypothetical protein